MIGSYFRWAVEELTATVLKRITLAAALASISAACSATDDKPEIVWFFACSDLCPKPMEEYMVRVYDGVKDRDECLKLNGVPGVLFGWSTQYYCAVAETDAPEGEESSEER